MIKRILLICVFMIVCSIAGTAQTSMLFYLKINDDDGLHDSLIYGNNGLATFGLDSVLQEYACGLGEPPYAFFTCPRNPSPVDWPTQLCHKDLRDTGDAATRIDSFYILILNDDPMADSANVVLRWPDAEWMNARCDSMKLVVRYDTLLPADGLNMASTNTLLISRPYDLNGWNTSAPVLKLRIFKWGLHQPNIDAVRNEGQVVPSSFSLKQNFPEPFNPSTTVQFTLPHESHVTLKVYNLLGQEVQTLVNDTRTAGTYNVQVDAAQLASGVYFYRLQAGTFLDTKKMLVLK